MMNPGGRRPWQTHVDMYRKIPNDLMEGTSRGSILSYLSLLLMVVLFLWETRAYLQTTVVKDLALDKSEEPRLRLNFNITMTDLRCDWAVIDVVSVLGTDQNVTAHVTKWNIDADGVRKGYKGRNRNQKDIEMFDEAIEETLEELHENGEDAVVLDEESLAKAIKDHEYVFVDFFASWCSHCKDLAPTWEALAEVMTEASVNRINERDNHDDDEIHHQYSAKDYEHAVKVNLPVVVGKIDCVIHKDLCNMKQNIMAYPTLRLFIDGEVWGGGADYKGHRTVMEMVDWLMHMEEQHKKILEDKGDAGQLARKLHTAHESAMEYMGLDDDDHVNLHGKDEKTRKRTYSEWKDSEHPGCQLTGHLMVDRVPGNFHILARSKHQELVPHLTNVSHQINTLSIGSPNTARFLGTNADTPPEVLSKLSPMNGNVYTTYNLHESYHHYLKVVSTGVPGLKGQKAYQIIPSSQLSYYTDDMVPEAKFVYDLSPISVTYRSSSRRWYEYVTSLFAIIGGVFTMVGMIESSIHATVSKAKRRTAYQPPKRSSNGY
eukprot:CAMPEP_0201125944 /NCGR_PEP_ID=MMETSP0850-20130426/23873_1 /ASSEMBLY_ACC=CAM_ASM_000622 /TAXON_ID=183588 /ORGANISM="Pseudo-nitzschia fraudulenta, Strain WWA7" /LENGTH=544 /DNA_ID=CAMNT_0047394163 /DNA_START=139 /DNA_END=1773 /DNA_ORIENTATION=-